jgi:hypothetical protein
VNVRSAVAIGDAPVAVTVKLKLPATVGVPVSAPPADSDTPAGRVDPDLTVYETALVAVSCTAVIAEPWVESARAAAVTQTGGVATTHVKVLSAVATADAPVAVTTKL